MEHGQLMILAFFVFNSISVFLARYFKETGGRKHDAINGCFDMSWWIWVSF